MNKYHVKLTKQFNEELNQIYNYICFSLYSPRAANKLYDKIKNSVLGLKVFPERNYRISNLKEYKKYNIRRLLIDNYIILYEVNNNTRQVSILHIFHSNQDYFNLL